MEFEFQSKKLVGALSRALGSFVAGYDLEPARLDVWLRSKVVGNERKALIVFAKSFFIPGTIVNIKKTNLYVVPGAWEKSLRTP